MCFLLYAATTKPLPRSTWELGSRDLPVEPLDAHDAEVKQHFGLPEVQFVGSTSGCSCDLPHLMFLGGEWPYFEDPDAVAENAESDRLNREALVSLLQRSEDSSIELYGV